MFKSIQRIAGLQHPLFKPGHQKEDIPQRECKIQIT
jgi:hypothetical protein